MPLLVFATVLLAAPAPPPPASLAVSAERPAALADTTDRPRTAHDRQAYWCLADTYRAVADQTDDPEVADAARRAAEQYERVAPTAAEVEALGLVVGQSVVVGTDEGATCETTVRASPRE